MQNPIIQSRAVDGDPWEDITLDQADRIMGKHDPDKTFRKVEIGPDGFVLFDLPGRQVRVNPMPDAVVQEVDAGVLDGIVDRLVDQLAD